MERSTKPQTGTSASEESTPEALAVSERRKIEFGWSAWTGVGIVGFWLLIVVFGTWLAPHSQAEILTHRSFSPAGEVGLLGSDFLGRDVFSRMLYGARMTIGLSLAATILAFSVGVSFGFVAAAAGGWVDNLISRVNDAVMAFPSIILALIVITALGSSIPILIVTVGLVEATRVFRLSRAVAMDTMVMDFVDVARARGEGLWWIIRREVLPNVVLPLSAEFGLRYVFAILLLSGLSFLGLGVQPPQADWGIMVRENMAGLMYGSLASFIPAAAIASLSIGVNLIVDSMLTMANKDISEEML